MCLAFFTKYYDYDTYVTMGHSFCCCVVSNAGIFNNYLSIRRTSGHFQFAAFINNATVNISLNPHRWSYLLILEREGGRERNIDVREKHGWGGGEENINWSPAPTCSALDLNLQLFGVWDGCSNQLSHLASAINVSIHVFWCICSVFLWGIPRRRVARS